MNDTSESTHYQIELTSRQVLTALVVILVCLFAAFFAGVSIGRNAGADDAAMEIASVGQASRSGERFDFFSRTASPPGADGGGAAAPGSAAARSSSDSPSVERSLLDEPPIDESVFGPDPSDEELEGADPETLFEDESGTPNDRAGLSPPEAMGRGEKRRRAAAQQDEAVVEDEPVKTPPSGAPLPLPPPAEPPAPATEGAAASTVSAAAADSGFYIQVLATTNRDKAGALVARLVDADFKALTVPSDEGGRTVYRVRVGPFSDRELATRQAAEIKSRWGLDSWISPGTP